MIISIINGYTIRTIESPDDVPKDNELDQKMQEMDILVPIYATITISQIKKMIKEIEKKTLDEPDLEVIYVHRYLFENSTILGVKYKECE